MRVQFLQVGRGKTTWIAEMQFVDDVTLYREVKRKRALGSRGIDFDWKSDTEGTIYVGGFRPVGTFHVLPDCCANEIGSRRDR